MTSRMKNINTIKNKHFTFIRRCMEVSLEKMSVRNTPPQEISRKFEVIKNVANFGEIRKKGIRLK
jgi:hypothetical protein